MVGAQNANAKTGPRERLTRSDCFVKAEHPCDLSDFILMPVPVGFDHMTAVTQGTYDADVVMVCLDFMCIAAYIGIAAFDQVGTQRALTEIGGIEIKI